MTRNYTRRRTLALSAGALAAVTGAGCLGSAQQTRRIELRADENGWIGRHPESIRGTTNPTLSLKTGATYELLWRNGDGVIHEFALLDESGTVLHASGSAKKKGKQRTLAFTAEPSIVAYHDHYHPETLHGAVEVGRSGLRASSAVEPTE